MRITCWSPPRQAKRRRSRSSSPLEGLGGIEGLGTAGALPAVPMSSTVPPAAYAAYRATSNYVSPDGRTVQYFADLRAGDPAGTSALNAVPAIRSAITRLARVVGA